MSDDTTPTRNRGASGGPGTKKLVAGAAAVLLTLAAAGAAVAVNLDTSDPSGSAGLLTATDPISSSQPDGSTPSTIYLDQVVTVPPGSSAVVPTTPVAGGGQPAPGPGGSRIAGDRDEHEDDDRGDHDDDHESDREDRAEHEGRDDDD